jgi:hypothetical protein
VHFEQVAASINLHAFSAMAATQQLPANATRPFSTLNRPHFTDAIEQLNAEEIY